MRAKPCILFALKVVWFCCTTYVLVVAGVQYGLMLHRENEISHRSLGPVATWEHIAFGIIGVLFAAGGFGAVVVPLVKRAMGIEGKDEEHGG